MDKRRLSISMSYVILGQRKFSLIYLPKAKTEGKARSLRKISVCSSKEPWSQSYEVQATRSNLCMLIDDICIC